MSDLIDREKAVRSLLDLQSDVREWDIGYFYHKIIQKCINAITSLPSAEPNGRLEQAISGKTAEEVYEILHWLMYQYAKQYTASRDAVIEWLKGEGADMRGGTE